MSRSSSCSFWLHLRACEASSLKLEFYPAANLRSLVKANWRQVTRVGTYNILPVLDPRYVLIDFPENFIGFLQLTQGKWMLAYPI